MTEHGVPLIIRGRVIEDQTLQFVGRRDAITFLGPDVSDHVDELALRRPSALGDQNGLRFNDILDYLAELGSRLSPSRNAYMAEALEISFKTSGLGEAILRHCYDTIGHFFDRQVMRDMVDNTIGSRFLDGWVETQTLGAGRASVRAFGARAVHIIAGNVPGISALTIVRNAVTRSDAIIKTPSNDPLTAAGIVRTMIDMAPDHPLTRHVSVAYWKGGDTRIEESLYQPANIEKIVAWGGFASISHVARYIQPGIDLITLDPKLSSTIIGRDAFLTEHSMQEAVDLLALDAGHYNQEACTCARVVYAQTGTSVAGLERARKMGKMLHAAIAALPDHLSGPAVRLDRPLQDEIDTLRMSSDDHLVIGGGRGGAVIVSLSSEPVEFARLLANRVVNIVPIDTPDTAVAAVNAYTQTIGVYPESLKRDLRDRLAGQGAQRVVSLGGARLVVLGGPQDAIEPLRRMCRWVADEQRLPQDVLAAPRQKGVLATAAE